MLLKAVDQDKMVLSLAPCILAIDSFRQVCS